jgi:hypothetical protein
MELRLDGAHEGVARARDLRCAPMLRDRELRSELLERVLEAVAGRPCGRARGRMRLPERI